MKYCCMAVAAGLIKENLTGSRRFRALTSCSSYGGPGNSPVVRRSCSGRRCLRVRRGAAEQFGLRRFNICMGTSGQLCSRLGPAAATSSVPAALGTLGPARGTASRARVGGECSILRNRSPRPRQRCGIAGIILGGGASGAAAASASATTAATTASGRGRLQLIVLPADVEVRSCAATTRV